MFRRFDDLYIPEPMSGCWLWVGAYTKNGGYGVFQSLGESRAHRVSWRLAFGDIPDGLWVLHKCDVTCCVNPDHLFLGDHDANMADRKAKGRACRGERNGRAKLSPAQVADIKRRLELGCNYRALAKEYGVNHRLISMIRDGHRWRHV